MKRLKSQHSAGAEFAAFCDPIMSFKWRVLTVLSFIFGPLFLLYLTLQCEKSKCQLFQLPLDIPIHASVYFSTLSASIVLGFIALILFFNSFSRPTVFRPIREQTRVPTGLISLFTCSLTLCGIYYFHPEYIKIIHGEVLRMQSTVIVISLIFSTVIFLFSEIGIMKKDRDCSMSFFYGSVKSIKIKEIELKKFFYIYVGINGWALLDLLILLNFLIDNDITGPLVFLTATHYLIIMHALACENLMSNSPFLQTEGLGFFWFMRVFIYLPFFHSLPVNFAACNGISLPKLCLLADSLIFLIGFCLYLASIHQREKFVKDPSAYKRSSCFWELVHNPAYLSCIVIWISWTIATGFGGVPVVVLIIHIGTLLRWLMPNNKSHMGKKQIGAAELLWVF